MRQRRLTTLGVLVAGLAVMSLSVSGQTPAAGKAQAGAKQTPKAPSGIAGGKSEAAIALDRARQPVPKNWVTPKTAWGEPDLEGTWSYATTTPLNRPANAGEKVELSQAEIDKLAEDAAARQDGTPADGVGNYGNLWYDRGQSSGRTSLIIDPPDGRVPPLTDEARNARTRGRGGAPPASYLDLGATLRCITYHGVPPLPSGYNNTYQIFQSPGMVGILDEDIHHVRLVPMDGRPHLTSEVRHWNGDSRGHWEGNTLVVETTNFSPKSELRYGGSESTTSVERFTRTGPYLIDYKYTITDPKVFTKPFTVAIPLAFREDKILEYACHEGNYAAEGILAGARVQEKEKAQKTQAK